MTTALAIAYLVCLAIVLVSVLSEPLDKRLMNITAYIAGFVAVALATATVV